MALVLLLATAGAGLGLTSPAYAESGRCDPGTGVTLVVDYSAFGRGVDIFCDPSGGGKTASAVMSAVGVDWDPVSGQAFVCRIEGLPGSDTESCQRTPPANAYWGLFWSDGKSGWSYASSGVSSQKAVEGGSIGWRFQTGSRQVPGAAPTKTPTGGDGGSSSSGGSGGSDGSGGADKPGGSGGSGGSAGSGGGQASSGPSGSPTSTPSSSPSSSPSASPSTDPSASAQSSDGAGSDRAAQDSDKGDKRAEETKAAKSDRADKAERKAQQRKDRKRDRAEEDGEDDSLAAEDDDAVATAEADYVDPVSAEPDGFGADDAALLAFAGLAVAGLATYAVVTARRRRS